MLTKLIEGMNNALTPDEFICLLKQKIASKKEELELSEFWSLISEQATVTEK